jgi:hypothetical protein
MMAVQVNSRQTGLVALNDRDLVTLRDKQLGGRFRQPGTADHDYSHGLSPDGL